MGAITGAVAAAYYKEVDANIINFTLGKLPEELRRIVELFEECNLGYERIIFDEQTEEVNYSKESRNNKKRMG